MDGNYKITVYLLGDSITQGLGSKKVNFADELARILGDRYEIINLAYTGTTIDYALKLLDEGKIMSNGRSICVVLYGNVDAQIRPRRTGRVFPHIPKRFQCNGMLMPRPFYSCSWGKHAGQLLDNVFRKMFSSLIIAVDGTEQWVSLESFEKEYSCLLDRLFDLGIGAIACSCVYIDGRLFPGTPSEYESFNNMIRVSAEERGIPYVDMWSMFETDVKANGWSNAYNKDHFHPNGTGYRLMARVIAAAISKQDVV